MDRYNKFIREIQKNISKNLLFILLFLGSLLVLNRNFLPAGYTFGLFFLIGYYKIMLYALRQTGFFNEFKDISKKEILKICMLFIGSILFILRESSLNDVIYCWDSCINWFPAVSLSGSLFNNTFDALLAVFKSINHQDYNDFLGLLMALPLHILGMDFYIYTLIVWIMFGILACLILAVTCRYVFYSIGWQNIPYSMLVLVFLLIPAITSQIFYGYAYINFLLPGSVLFWLLVKRNYQEFDIKTNVIVSLLSIILLISNRTSTYMVIGYFASLAVMYFAEAYTAKRYQTYIISMLKNLGFIGALNLLILLLFFKGFFLRSVFNNFKESYAAYGFGLNFYEKLINTVEYWGLLLFILCVFGVIITIKSGSRLLLHYMLAAVAACGIPVIMLNMILQMNRHQMYDIVIPVYFMIMIFVAYCYQSDKRKFVGYILMAVLCFNFVNAYAEDGSNHKMWSYVHQPLRRDDVSQIRFIVSQIRSLAGADKKIYIIASGGTFNDDVFRKAEFPKEIVSLPTLQASAHVDLKDGFFISFLDADIVVVTDPVQLHMREQDQRVVTIPADIMLGKNRISEHFTLYEEYYTYPNKNDVKSKIVVKIFTKHTAFDMDDINYIEQKYDAAYCNYPQLFHDRFEEYKKNMKEQKI